MARRLLLALGLAAVSGLTACAELPAEYRDPAHLGPFYSPRNHAGDPVMPPHIRRVVLLPVCAGELVPVETAAVLDATLLEALQRQVRFEVVPLPREECRRLFGRAEYSSASALPAGFVAKLAERYAAEAVVFVDLTAYQPYRPLAVGFRAKLATAGDIRLAWTFDEILSANHPAVANSARRFYLKADRGGQPLDLSPTALQSPRRFVAYAADAMFATLPPR